MKNWVQLKRNAGWAFCEEQTIKTLFSFLKVSRVNPLFSPSSLTTATCSKSDIPLIIPMLVVVGAPLWYHMMKNMAGGRIIGIISFFCDKAMQCEVWIKLPLNNCSWNNNLVSNSALGYQRPRIKQGIIRGDYSTKFVRGDSTPKSNSLPSSITFKEKGNPFLYLPLNLIYLLIRGSEWGLVFTVICP